MGSVPRLQMHLSIRFDKVTNPPQRAGNRSMTGNNEDDVTRDCQVNNSRTQNLYSIDIYFKIM
jgi:hypothetical protein